MAGAPRGEVDQMEQKKKIRIAVIVLSALLAVSLLALGGTFIYRRLAAGGNTTVSVPDNVITSTGDIDTTGTTAPVKTGDGNGAAGTPRRGHRPVR